MPPRHTIFFILAFWAASTAWLFYRDIRPYVTPGNPPPFTISLFDEAEAFRFRDNDRTKNKAGLEWSIFQNGDIMGYAVTWITHDRDDTFELKGEYKFWSKGRFTAHDPDQIIDSGYRVSREGELRDVHAKVTVVVPFIHPAEVSASLQGKVASGLLRAHVEVDLPPPFGKIQRDLDPVEVKSRGSLLNPMQPLSRLPGLRRGQHWRMPMVDPLDDVIRSLAAKVPGLNEVPSPKIPYLEAEVLPHTVLLQRKDGKVECLVVEYRGEDLTARTLVGADDALVYVQEVTHQGQNLKLVREDPGARLEDKLNRQYEAMNKKK